MSLDKKIKLRQVANFSILRELSKIMDKYPELRFQQILINFKVVEPGKDKFYEESSDTFNNLRNEICKHDN